ncbi:Response regulator PleD [compost metagenome]
MSRLLLAGFPEDLSAWLQGALPEVSLTVLPTAADAAEALRHGDWGLVVLEGGLPDGSALGILKQLRADPRHARLPVMVCVARDLPQSALQAFVGELGVAQLLFHPLNREEMRRQIASLLRLPLAAPLKSAERPALPLARLRERFIETTEKRIATLEAALSEALQGTLDGERQREAEREAHKLGGSLGTFGFAEGSRLALEMETLWAGASLPSETQLRLSELLVALRRELANQPEVHGAAPSEPTAQAPRILIVDDDPLVAERLIAEARAREFRPVWAADLTAARKALAQERPEVVLVDLSLAGSSEDGRMLLAELSAHARPIPALVLSGKDGLLDRIDVARLGAARYLHKSIPAAAIFEAVREVIQRPRAEAVRVLAVDDDPQVLAVLESLLTSQGIQTRVLSDALRFWEVLEETQPDLIVLDVDMPYVSGVELCRVVRGDARWSTTPVLFLTARRDPEDVQRLFATGADDYVLKPLLGPELLTRIRNRLERTRMLKNLAETDTLTGAATLGKFTRALNRACATPEAPVTLALLDVDQLKRINRSHGHAVGDMVIRRLAELLLRAFPQEGVVARWGGEEFMVLFEKATKAEALASLQALLASFREIRFDEGGAALPATFSAGVVQYPEDGADLKELYVAAEAAVNRAKQVGPGGFSS